MSNEGSALAQAEAWRQNLFLADVPSDLVDHLQPWLLRKAYAAGDDILIEGEPADRVCLLTEGRVGIYKGAERARLGTVEAGASFGEMGVLSGAPRSATVNAETAVVVWSITLATFEAFRARTGVDLFALSMRAHADAMGERLTRVSDVAAQWQRDRMEQYRIRVSFGTLFTHVILMMFLYISALGVLREFSSAGSSSTLTSSVLLGLMALGAAWIMKASGFPPRTFGFTLARWRWVLLDSLVWSAAFCAAMTLGKAALLYGNPSYAHLPMFQPWTSPAGMQATLLAYGLYVLLSPVQEFVARGLMQGALTRMLTGRWVPLQAILVSNAVFSISHQHLGLGYAMAVFVPGLFWGWLYHRHGSLLGVCVSHAVIGLWGTGVLDLSSLVT
ncbi:cyclic nucleotide-binding domain-containing protein [Hydrogenophaga sp.]|uniref:cyclic nucleotide-binding domain-containing protein n=1 Tax=Hydrogenophaga sp. TaxID=1904254 RepID=UPI00271DDF4C|nr:cyclic nucleotide-binding domain-containing protein [Hydrogenophaga sp.]MDO9434022.1 cyclic nucleotide-binding domain-containing protein [Hydrogenophaga sp.]